VAVADAQHRLLLVDVLQKQLNKPMTALPSCRVSQLTWKHSSSSSSSSRDARLLQQLDSERAEKQALQALLEQFQQWVQQSVHMSAVQQQQQQLLARAAAGAPAMGVMPGQ
jgi:uncharacterized protein YlxW (UPF0749 family)